MKKQVAFFTIIFMIIDQLIKFFVEKIGLIDLTVINNLFNLTYVKNTGGAWGILSNNMIVLILISVLVLIVLIKSLYQEKKENIIMIVSYSFLFGGIVGNLIDRLIRGYVVDYLHFYHNSYHFPVFNFADILIVLGVLLMIIMTIKEDIHGYYSRRREEKN